MWNWLVSSLALGARILLFEDLPSIRSQRLVAVCTGRESLTILGTSAKYLAAIEKAGSRPGKTFDLPPQGGALCWVTSFRGEFRIRVSGHKG